MVKQANFSVNKPFCFMCVAESELKVYEKGNFMTMDIWLEEKIPMKKPWSFIHSDFYSQEIVLLVYKEEYRVWWHREKGTEG